MAASLFIYNEPGGLNGAGYARRFAQHLISDVSFLSLESTTSDTSSSYDVTLAVSFDETTKVRVYNSSSSVASVQILFNGTAAVSKTVSINASETGTQDTYICAGANFLFAIIGRNGETPEDNYGCFVGQLINAYDDHKVTVTNSRISLYADQKINANGQTYSAQHSSGGAFPQPYTNWGGQGHLYGAVPRYYQNRITAAPVIGFIGGTDVIYTLYDNGSVLAPNTATTFTIDGHSFFCINTYGVTNPQHIAIRLS